jgi:cyclase
MKRGTVVRIAVLGGVVSSAMAVAILGAQQPAAPAGGQGRAGGAGRGPGFPPVSAAEKVAENLFMVPGQGGNTAVWVAANGVVLVDTKLANNGQAILDEVKKVTDKPVTHIINTHTHGDHTGSNQFFPATVEIVTQANTGTNMQKLPVFQEAANKHGLPDRTFKDTMTLLGGKDAIDLRYFGAAHTNGDAFVVFRSARVMHAAYPETLAKAAREIKNVDRVIPGHSAVVPWQDFVDFGEFNRLFLAHARASLKAGRTPEQAMMNLTLPEKFKGYNLTGGRGGPGGNFGVIFEELKKQ